ncbi:MAG: lytic transglycosylase domain-containing protein, partial [Patescibacteria group bacterium]|nr:lytic transglycosylase domain-containing protein [Patescibacteria group bacterium]
LINHESGWQPSVVSKTGAVGLGQFLPSTAAGFGVTTQQLKDDPALALDLSARLLHENAQQFGGDFQKAFAAYFIGPGNIVSASRSPDWLGTADSIAKQYNQGTVTSYLGAIGALNSNLGGAASQGEKGPNGRTFAQVTGTAYLSPQERDWYKAQEAQRLGIEAPKGTQTMAANANQDQQAQQLYGTGYDKLSAPQQARVDFLLNQQTPTGQSVPTYDANDVLALNGAHPSKTNPDYIEFQTGGRGSPTISFTRTRDANGNYTGQVTGPEIFSGGKYVPYTGALPQGLKPVSGGPASPGATTTTPVTSSGATSGGGSSPATAPANPAVREAPGITPPPNRQTSPGGGGLGGVLSSLLQTGGPGGTGPYSLSNPQELARLMGLDTGAASDQGVPADVGRQITNLLTALAPATTQPQGGGSGSAQGGAGATTGGGGAAADNGGGGGGLGNAASGLANSVGKITPPSLSGAGGLLDKGTDLLGEGLGWLGRQLGIGGGNGGGGQDNGGDNGRPAFAVGALTPGASADVSGQGQGDTGFASRTLPASPAGEAQTAGIEARADAGGSDGNFATVGAPVNATASGSGVPNGVIATPGSAATEVGNILDPNDPRYAQGFADGGRMMVGTPNPVGIVDLLTGNMKAVAGEAGPEQVKVTPMRKGGRVFAGTDNSSQWQTGDTSFLADGGTFDVGQSVPSEGVAFSGPKQFTGYSGLSYYSRPDTGLSPYPPGLGGHDTAAAAASSGVNTKDLNYDVAHGIPEGSLHDTRLDNLIAQQNAMSPEFRALLRATSGLTPTLGSQSSRDISRSINGILSNLGLGPERALGNSSLRQSLSNRLGLSPRASSALGILAQ